MAVKTSARDELRCTFPHLTDKVLDRWADDYGPIGEEPQAHKHLRAIRKAIDEANSHLARVGFSDDALSMPGRKPDRQLRSVLQALGVDVHASTLAAAERAAGFRPHDLPGFRARDALVEALLNNDSKLTPRFLALVSLAVGFVGDQTYRSMAVSEVIDREVKVIRALLSRLNQSGTSWAKSRAKRVVSGGTRGRPQKRN